MACLILIPVARATAAGQTVADPVAAAPANDSVLDKLIQKIEPGGSGIPEHLSIYLQFYQRTMINDTRLFAFHVTPRWHDDGLLELTGFVEFEENKKTLHQFLNRLGFEQIDNRIEVLPSQDLGSKRFGFITATHCLCFDRPVNAHEVVTDCLLGEPLYLLKEADRGFFLCHTADGYIGYIDGKKIHRVAAAEFTRYQSGPQILLTGDMQRSDKPSIPAGARIRWVGNETDYVIAELPAGDEISIPSDQCTLRRGAPNPAIERILKNADHLMGTPYLWGGKTSGGIDCSGLVQVAFAAEGIYLPRDSSQQIHLGRLTATRWYRDGMRRGDTLYFLGSTGKIVHTGIYLGAGKYLESAGPGVQVTSLNPKDTDFNVRRNARFAYAKRLIE